jgi:N-acetylmuramoyl-L-alanine amidase
MSLTKQQVNQTLNLQNQSSKRTHSSNLNKAVSLVRDNQITNNVNKAVEHGPVGTSGIISLNSTDNAAQKGNGTNLVQADDFALKSGAKTATQLQNETVVQMGGHGDSDGKTTISEDNWNVLSVEFWTDSSDLSALSAEINSIGGGIGDTIAGLMRLITALGALADLASNLNVGAATGSAAEKAGTIMKDKATQLGNDLQGGLNGIGDAFQGFGDISNIQELGNQFDTLGNAINNFTGPLLTATDIITNPADVFLDTLTEETGIGNAFKEVEAGFNDITTGINDTLNSIGDTIDAAVAIADPIMETIAKAERLGATISANAGILQNLNEIYSANLGKDITKITGGASLSRSETGKIMDQINSGKEKDIANAVKTIVGKNTNLHPDMIPIVNATVSFNNTSQLQDNIVDRAKLAGVDPAIIADFEEIFVNIEDNVSIFDTTMQGNLFVSQNDFFSKNKNLKDYGSQYESDVNVDGTPKFLTCDSYEELAQEVMVTDRDITKIVIHGSNTYLNQYLTSRDIHQRMIDRGYDGMQYHYVIRRDGTLERGIPSNKVTAVTDPTIANNSIDIIMVGGINAATGTENPDRYKGIGSYTRQQFNTLESLLVNWYRRYPGVEVVGHQDIDTASSDPAFDVKGYVKDRFDV